MTEFLHEIVRERNFNQDTLVTQLNWVDPWELDTPIPYALNMRGNTIVNIIHPNNSDLGAS
jgi:hypothetical protein